MAAICFVISVYKQLKTQAAGFSKHCIDSLFPPPPPNSLFIENKSLLAQPAMPGFQLVF